MESIKLSRSRKKYKTDLLYYVDEVIRDEIRKLGYKVVYRKDYNSVKRFVSGGYYTNEDDMLVFKEEYILNDYLMEMKCMIRIKENELILNSVKTLKEVYAIIDVIRYGSVVNMNRVRTIERLKKKIKNKK